MTQAPGNDGVARALRHRSFQIFFAGSAAFNIGFWLAHPTMQGLMGDLADDNKGFWVGALFTALFLPAATVSPIAGVFIDRSDRRKALTVAYLTVFACALAMGLLSGSFNRYSLLVAALAIGTAYAIMAPAQMTAVATAVPQADIRSAVTMQATINNLSRIAAPIASAPLVASRHYREAFFVFAGCAVLAAISASRLVLRPSDPVPRIGFRDQLRTGLAHARERPPAFDTLVSVGVFSLFGASHIVLLLAYTEEVLGKERGSFAVLLAATGVGAFAGALAAGMRKGPPSFRFGTSLLIVYGGCIVALGFVRSYPVAVAVEVAVGFFQFISITTMQTLVQYVVDDDKRGRVMGLFHLSWTGLVPFGSIFLGFVAEGIGLGIWQTLVFTGSVVAATATWLTLRRSAAVISAG